jgi:hypothetical protein
MSANISTGEAAEFRDLTFRRLIFTYRAERPPHTAIPLPFVSYTGKRVLWYIGWQKTGNFGLKFNLLNSTVQVV